MRYRVLIQAIWLLFGAISLTACGGGAQEGAASNPATSANASSNSSASVSSTSVASNASSLLTASSVISSSKSASSLSPASSSTMSSKSSSLSSSKSSSSSSTMIAISSSRSSTSSSASSMSSASSSMSSQSSSAQSSASSNTSSLSTNPCIEPTTIFCETFENGNFQRWDDFDGNPAPDNTIVTDPGPHNISGNKVGRLQAKQNVPQSGADFTKSLSNSYDKLYLRYFQKFEPGFNLADLNHAGGGMFANRNKLGASGIRPNGSDYIWSILQYDPDSFHLYTYYPGMYQDCVDPNGSCWGDHLPCSSDEGTGSGPSNYCTNPDHRDLVPVVKPQTNRWYCMEVMIDLGAAVSSASLANGEQNIWIDGVAQGPFQKLWFRNTTSLKLQGLWIASYFHNGQSTTSGILYDDIVVSTTRIGCN